MSGEKTPLFVRKIPGGFFSLVDEALYPGKIYWVDATNGDDTNNGGPDDPLATITAAVALCGNTGDTIFLVGNFTEAVVIGTGKDHLRIIGTGRSPKATQWTSLTDTISLKIGSPYVLVKNIYFKPPTYTAGLPSSIQLGAASYTMIRGCRFQGQTASWRAIYSPVCLADNVEISDCDFMYMNTATYGAAILGVEAGGLSYSGWKILNNRFHSCVTAIDINGRCCTIKGNVIMEYGINPAGTVGAILAMGIDLSGTSSGANSVTENQLGGTYSATLYVVGASGDQWAGNYNVFAGTAGLCLTAANPA